MNLSLNPVSAQMFRHTVVQVAFLKNIGQRSLGRTLCKVGEDICFALNVYLEVDISYWAENKAI